MSHSSISPRGFRLRYSLRALLLAMTFGIVALALLTHAGRRQRDTVAAILRSGGSVYHCEPSDNRLIRTVQECVTATLGPDFAYPLYQVALYVDRMDVAQLDAFPHVIVAYIGGHGGDGKAIRDVLSRMPNVIELSISDFSPLVNKDLTPLQSLRHLEELSLYCKDGLQGESMVRVIPPVEQLKGLCVECPRLTSGMVANLSKMKTLERIRIFVWSEQIPSLNRQLQEALPNCKVASWDLRDWKPWSMADEAPQIAVDPNDQPSD
jgi:hypothetical protein